MSQDIQGDAPLNTLTAGIGRAQAGDLDGAAGAFSGLIAENGRDADALNNLAVVYRRKGLSQDALGAILDAIECNPGKAEYQYTLGKIYRDLGNFKSAAMAFARAVESDGALIPAYVNLGAMYMLLKEWDKAERFLRMGLAAAPDHRVLQAAHEAAAAAKAAGTPDGAPAYEIPEEDDIFTGADANDGALTPDTPDEADAAGTPESLPAEASPASGLSTDSEREDADANGGALTPDTPDEANAAGTPESLPRDTASSERASTPLSLEKVRGLFHFFRYLVTFMPPQAAQFITGSENGGGIEGIIAALDNVSAWEDFAVSGVADDGDTDDGAVSDRAASAGDVPAENPSPEYADNNNGGVFDDNVPAGAGLDAPGPDAENWPDNETGSPPDEAGAEGTFSRLVGVLRYLEQLADHLPRAEDRLKMSSQVDSIVRMLDGAGPGAAAP